MTRGLWLSLLVGCGAPTTIPKEDFPAAAADVVCARTRECARGQFDAVYFGLSDCRAEVARDLGELAARMDDLDCTYDADEAAIVWTDTRDSTCEDFYEGDWLPATEDIWRDCEGGDREGDD